MIILQLLKTERVPALKGLAARESLQRDHPGGFPSPAFHTCGSTSLFAHAVVTEIEIGKILSPRTKERGRKALAQPQAGVIILPLSPNQSALLSQKSKLGG